MVGIAQSVERLVVVQEVAGSSPVTHPTQIPVSTLLFTGIFCMHIRGRSTKAVSTS